MSSLNNQSPSEGLHKLHITRTFNAPRGMVYEVFASAEHARHWMGPRGFVATHLEQDTRIGGEWRACLHQVGEWNDRTYPDLWMGGVFHEVTPPERLVYTLTWEGQGGQPTRETVVTILFSEIDDNTTRMDFHQTFFDTVEDRDDHSQGWNSVFDRLDDFLKSFISTRGKRSSSLVP